MAPIRKITLASLAPIHGGLNSSPVSFMQSMQQIVEDESISRKSSGYSSASDFQEDSDYHGKGNNLSLQSDMGEKSILRKNSETSSDLNSTSRKSSGYSSDTYFSENSSYNRKEDKLPLHGDLKDKKSILKKISGVSSHLNFAKYFGFEEKVDKQPLHSGLKDPIWVTPSICTHQENSGEKCFMCRRDTGKKISARPDFTILNLYGTRRPAKKKSCKCGTITTISTCFSISLSIFILIFVLYLEVVIKQKNPVTVHFTI